MAEELRPDICIIGGGPGGMAVALGAAREGVPVLLVEKKGLGGGYHRAGALGAKALLTTAATREWLRRGQAAGITGAPVQVNLSRLREHVAATVDDASAAVTAERLEALGVEIVAGAAKFVDRRRIVVDDITIRPRRFVLAVGARASVPEIDGLDSVGFLTPENALDLGRKPTHVMVLDAGPHGLELAQAYNRLGIDSSVIDSGPALPGHDQEQSEVVLTRLRAEGVRLRTGVDVVSVHKRRGGVRVVIREAAEDGEAGNETNIDGTQLVVIGRPAPALDGLDLDAARVDHTKDGIVVDAQLRTTNRRIFAIGDAVAGPPGVARARSQAARVVKSIVFRLSSRADASQAVRLVHTDPPIAATGLSEDDAVARGEKFRILRYPFSGVERSHIEGLPHGAIKVVVSDRGRVLGASVVGENADELLTPWSLAVARRLPISALAGIAVASPSLSEATVAAAESFRQPDLTPSWRRSIIRLLRKFG